MITPNFSQEVWQKSSRTGNDTKGGACVEVAQSQRIIGVRDSKLRGKSPILAFDKSEWVSFLTAVKRGDANFS